MKSVFYCTLVLCFMLIAVIGCDQGMNMMEPAVQGPIPDANLAAAIREEIGNSITKQTLLNLTELEVPNRGITDLTGLEHARNLKHLNFGNEVEVPIDAVEMELGAENQISDLSPLAGLTQLTSLVLSYNTVSDITPLAGLKQLTELDLRGNTISDITPLAGLTQLTSLELGGNAISDITPLAGLTQLNYLSLWYNAISDVSPLVDLNLTGSESNRVGLDIQGNPLNAVSINTHIPVMQAKGIIVEFDTASSAVEESEEPEDTAAETPEEPSDKEVDPPEPEPDPYQLSDDFTTDNNGAITLIQGNAHLGAGATRGCLFLAGSINGVRYTVHEFKWQTRQNAAANWTDIDSNRCDDRDTDIVPIHGYDLNAADPGQYRAVLDITTTRRMKLKTNTVIVE